MDLQKLEKRGLVSKKPNPIFVFFVAGLYVFAWSLIFLLTEILGYEFLKITMILMGALTIFAIIFSIIHWWIFKGLE